MSERHNVTDGVVAAVVAVVGLKNPQAGVFAAGAAPTASVKLHGIVDRLADRNRRAQGYVLELAARLADLDDDKLEQRLLGSPDVTDLLLRVMAAAEATDLPEKLACLSIALGDSAADPTEEHVTWEKAFVRALDDLDLVHFQLLRRFRSTANELGLGDRSADHDRPLEALNRQQLDIANEDMPILSSLLAVLERHGLVSFDGLYYRISDFGAGLLDRLDEVGDLFQAARPYGA